jgi:hypothetical protein
MTGRSFGRLTVTSRAPKTRRDTVWNVRCRCGTEKTVTHSNLITGRTLSCGCLYRESRRACGLQSQANRDDLSGKRFGMLTVVKPLGKRDGSTAFMWMVRCECGAETAAGHHELKRGKKKSCGCSQGFQSPQKLKRAHEALRQYLSNPKNRARLSAKHSRRLTRLWNDPSNRHRVRVESGWAKMSSERIAAWRDKMRRNTLELWRNPEHRRKVSEGLSRAIRRKREPRIRTDTS